MSSSRLLWRALASTIRRGPMSDAALAAGDVPVDRSHLAAYARVCGFRLSDQLPPTYPHVLAFPLALELMSGPGFPFPIVGLVHIGNSITVERPLSAADRYDIAVHAENLRPHDRGQVVDLVATVSVAGEPVWRARSEYLHRSGSASRGRPSEAASPPAASPPAASPPAASPPAASATWRVGPDVARAYAGVSGDHNPIHTSAVAARLFGFPRRIAHGMWSKARCLAALEGRLPDAYTVEVAFKRPILLPSTVAFSASPSSSSQGWTFALHDARSGAPHLTGTIAG